jgi:predicted methyltransferase
MLSTHPVSMKRKLLAALAVLVPSLWMNGCAAPGPGSPQDLTPLYRQAIASPLRTDADRDADAKRLPLEFLKFTGVKPGMNVLDVSAGDGYTTQLLALAVGDQGNVWAQSPKLRQGLEARLASHPQANIIPVTRPFDDPVPEDAPALDLVTLAFNYHDIAYLPVDRAKMNRRIYDALKQGGHFVVLDHSARAGTGTADSKTLHRIDEALVINEITQAGFILEREGNAFRNPADPRDSLIFDMTIPVDNFALRFVKP